MDYFFLEGDFLGEDTGFFFGSTTVKSPGCQTKRLGSAGRFFLSDISKAPGQHERD
mgnify:CR=1 FL=1